MMLAAAPTLGVDNFAYRYTSNDGVAVRSQVADRGYADRWTGNSQPWRREQIEPSRRAAESWSGYDEAPYTIPRSSDRSQYGARADRWSSLPERARPYSDRPRPQYQDRFADGRRNDNGVGGRRAFQEPYGDYGYERPTPLPGHRVDDWRDDAPGYERPQWYGAEEWQQDRYSGQPSARDRRSAMDEGAASGIHGEGSRDPWDASYTPDWGVGNSSSFYDPEPLDSWGESEVGGNGWRREIEERPWGRRRPSPAKSSRSRQAESRRREDNAPPEAVYPYGGGFGPYGGNWYYPGLYRANPPPLGLPVPGPLSGLAAWERLLWAAGWPGMVWW
jgi:hypothetical protein